jgi:hypothetical protein
MQWRCRTADRIDPARRRNHNLHVASVKQLTHQRVDVMSALLSKTDLRELTMQVRLVPMNETARAVGRCGMAVPAIDGTMRASYLMMMRGQKQIVQHDDLAISSTALGAHRT